MPRTLSAVPEVTEAATVSRIYGRRELEQAFLEAFDRMGGMQRLVAWGAEERNYPEFLKLLVKFAPKEQVAEQSGLVLEYVSRVPQSPLNRPKPDEPLTRQRLLEEMDAAEGEWEE